MNSRDQKKFSDEPVNGGFTFDVQGSQRTIRQPETASDAAGAYAAAPLQNERSGNGKTKADKKLKIAGLIFAGLFVGAYIFMPKGTATDTSEAAERALESGMSTELNIGVRISSEDEHLAGEDLTITHSSSDTEAKIHVWDYAAEDGDYVQILVDGAPIGDPFMIKNKPVSFTVPTTGEIRILGTRDGGGGITYAVHYDVNGTTYFNGTDVGDGNLYTLIRE